jgi:hypothetical protein
MKNKENPRRTRKYPWIQQTRKELAKLKIDYKRTRSHTERQEDQLYNKLEEYHQNLLRIVTNLSIQKQTNKILAIVRSIDDRKTKSLLSSGQQKRNKEKRKKIEPMEHCV